MESLARLIEDCDHDIRSGRVGAAARRLSLLQARKVSRKDRLPLAALCRRANLYTLGLSLLAPIVRPQGRQSSVDATGAETAEYAVLLLRAGALSEALLTLKTVNPDRTPNSLLYLSFCYFAQYEFDQALPVLERYLKTDLDDYQRNVARVNFTFALLGANRLEAAEEQIRLLLSQDVDKGLSRLHSNCHAMLAQIRLAQKDFKSAREALEEAQRLLMLSNTNDGLFVRKWRAFLAAAQNKDLSPLQEYREIARQAKDWNGLREADLVELRAKYSQRLFDRLVFGTPFRSYRMRVSLELGRTPSQGKFEFWLGNERPPRVMDLAQGSIDGLACLRPGSKDHQVLDGLLRDFYRPMTVAGLHSHLFAGDFFDPHSSPNRMHQILARARKWLVKNEISDVIESSGGLYRLAAGASHSITWNVELDREKPELLPSRFQEILGLSKVKEYFTLQEAVTRLALPRSTIQRAVRWGIENGHLKKVGTTNTAKYVFISQDETHGAAPEHLRRSA